MAAHADPTILDALDPETHAAVERLVDAVERDIRHPPLADSRLVELRAAELPGFCVVLGHAEGGVAAYVHASPAEDTTWDIQTVLDPGAGDQELRRSLARHAMSEAARRGATSVRWWAVRADASDDELARDLGLAPHRAVLAMERPLPHPESPGLPGDVTLRRFRPGADEEEWLAVNAAAFAEHPEQGAMSRPELDARQAEPWFDPQDFLVADDAQGMCGFCWTKLPPESDEGEIYVIASHPRRRGEGLGRALVLAGLDHIASRGRTRGTLYTDADNIAAVGLYEALGFVIDHVDRAYEGAP